MERKNLIMTILVIFIVVSLIFLKNSYTLAEKIEVAKRYNLHGICVWRIGFETPSFWKVIDQKIGAR
ncbi:hypothetical protein QTP99_04880 [Caldanaerobacter subterraneus KAk]|uniref:hypothetical protein n=1 Tax=Caldanaerobacter subterraneus TaxID=911092 RepID=UPI0032C0A611